MKEVFLVKFENAYILNCSLNIQNLNPLSAKFIKWSNWQIAGELFECV